ncbi:GAF domain-containing sensor histidine kinase [Salegentibacter salarius]|uniref:GAF domain-containing sensor histidine kinase n=1 Tax=Salegentibacter salarius TaxID=435906 RepID=UPI0029372620|nr:GAF domain-containing sensor histidine kinase [Salegentibacter salarius]
MLIKTSTTHKNYKADVANINKIPIVSQLLDIVCLNTGMGFAAIARVTEDKWITCASKDGISFGLKSGDELEVETTLCEQVRREEEPIYIDNVATSDTYAKHPIPAMYGISSYISVPIYKKDGSFFGTLCAIDKKAAKIDTEEIRGMFQLYAELISFHLEAIEEKEKAVAELNEEQHIAELREQFIAILGHDLKNPIATTRMSAEILMKFSKEDIVQRNAALIKSTSIRMENLIDNLLDFARGRLGEGIKLNKTKDFGKLENILEQVINEIKTISPNRDFSTNIKIENPVNCDPNRIAQLCSNLLGNAVTHGSLDKPIELEAVCVNGEFKLEITNKGVKIPQKVREKLFEPFYRIEGEEPKQGLGLGLYIASEIARAHQGDINVKSSDKETVFSFIMPAHN